MNDRTRTILIASLAGVLALPSVLSAQEGKEQKAPQTTHCYGVNKCKGTGDCGGPGHGCANQNGCKRKGYIDMDKDTCLKLDGGSLTPPPEKPAKKESKPAKKAA